jgi:signal transduction histidine kinase
LAAILLLAGGESGDVGARLQAILGQAQWLADVVEGVIGDAADDLAGSVDVNDLASSCVSRAQSTADCSIEIVRSTRAMSIAPPVALSRALGCVLDNAVRAAGPGGHVTVEVDGNVHEVAIRVIDDGPGMGNVPTQNSLGLTITRGLVSACGGGFDLHAGREVGMVARIVLPGLMSTAVAS